MRRAYSRRWLTVVAFMIFAGSALALPATSAFAQDAGNEVSAADFSSGEIVVIFDGPLNVRSAASATASILDVLPTGELLEILSGPVAADGYNWYQIEWNDTLTGWVAEDFIATDTNGTFSPGDIVVIFDGPLNVRSAASTTASILDVLPTGEELEILSGPVSADGYSWYQIEWNGTLTGYVASDFISEVAAGGFSPGDDVMVVDGPLNVRDAASTSGSVVGILEQDATAVIVSGPTAADGYQWYRITGTYDGYVAGEFLGLAPDGPVNSLIFPVGSFVFINTDLLNVRDAAGLSSNVIDTESDGAIGTVMDGPTSLDGYTWYLVSFGEGQNTYQGWVAGEFLSGGVTVGQDNIVADGPLNVRDAATISGTAIDVLQTGDIVNVVSGPYFDTYIWFEVQYDSTTGYVAGRYLGALVVG